MYSAGNDFLGMHIDSQETVERAKKNDWPIKDEGDHSILEAPGGYKFIINHKPQPTDKGSTEWYTLNRDR